jgi:hypothetical protein
VNRIYDMIRLGYFHTPAGLDREAAYRALQAGFEADWAALQQDKKAVESDLMKAVDRILEEDKRRLGEDGNV